GQLFLNVTAPLTIDESLQLRTSDQVTGIRGTSLTYSKPSKGATWLQLLDGSTNVTWTGPDGIPHAQTVKAGEQLVIDQSIATVTPILTENIPPFAATEIMQNPALLLKIEAATSFTGAQIGQSASLLAEKEAAAIKANQLLQPPIVSTQDQDGTQTEQPTPPVPQDEYFTVTFDMHGDSNPPPASQSIKKGETATSPGEPTSSTEGRSFSAWCYQDGGYSEYDFSTPITQNITLYAQWTDTPH
ncbi:MAG: InlB B-repeat-containing protein, partial [Lachnospiraceae bacterium]